ncbi:MAG: sensor histidine kinase [Rhodanobacter sp.]
MTARSALLRAFFWMLLGSIAVMGALSFVEFRRALQSEIADNLQFGAGAVKERIDTFLFTQMESMRVWRNLQVMQDIRVNDVDKRISNFLSELQAGQGSIYQTLLCTDTSGRVVAATDRALIGKMAPSIRAWQQMPDSKLKDVFIATTYQPTGEAVVLRTLIPNAFGRGDIGTLYLTVDWGAVQGLLDKAAADGPRSLLLLDAQGRVIAASSALRERLDLPHQRMLHWVVPAVGATSYIHDGAALGYRSLLVGAAASSGYQQFKGLGWHILMIEPTSEAFRPVWRMLWGMLVLLLLTLALGLWLASRLAGRIAKPIVDLTEFTRRFRQGEETLPNAPVTTISEVTELFRAYVDMIQALDRSREQVVRAGKLAVVGEMAAVMVHEIRTPMSIVRSSAQLLARHTTLGERERELIGFILSETERLNPLVNMLLECARPKAPDFRPQDMHAIVDSVLNLITSRAEVAGVHLERDLEAQGVVFACDREQMMQVLLNLVLNALEFVSAGGRIAVSTYLEAGALWICVADDGPGVPPAIRELIFDPFFTRRQGGIGLGLTIVQQIVQAHGGEICVTDSPWGGAAFNIRLDMN